MQTNSESTKEHDNQSADLTQPIDASGDIRADRSFDAIADHFEKKVYGGLKGDIRLAVLRRDIFEYSAQMSKSLGRPLRILDVGAGLAQIAIDLAAQGLAWNPEIRRDHRFTSMIEDIRQIFKEI